MKDRISNTFIILGVLLLIFSAYLYWLRTDPNRLAFTTDSVFLSEKNSTSALIPAVLEIPSQNIRLRIVPSEINKDKWETTDNGVSYLTSSPTPGEVGNSIMYGHNWENILGNLQKVKPGQTVIIYLSDGSKRIFTIQATAEVSPDQTHVLKNTQDKRLTIYTCSGFLDSKRFVVSAILN